MNPCPAQREERLTTAERLRRWTLASVGVGCVALGALGVLLPGLPTTIFLIVASWCFVRSCPWLEDRLIRNRFFAPYVRYLNGDHPMPLRAKLATVGAMVLFATVSCALMLRAELPIWVPTATACFAAVGAFVIINWRPSPRSRAEAA